MSTNAKDVDLDAARATTVEILGILGIPVVDPRFKQRVDIGAARAATFEIWRILNAPVGGDDG
jgi:hypothetical protein